MVLGAEGGPDWGGGCCCNNRQTGGEGGGGGLNYMALGKSVNGRRSEDGDRRKLDNCLPVWTRAHGSVRAREIGSCHSFL